MAKTKIVKCPECAEEIELEEYLEAGDTIFCLSCDAEVKIVRLEPPQVEVVESVQQEDDLDADEGGEEF
ncbi:MAG: hypothetical protein WCI77_08385 [Candidatus Omnitrophota bacterium]